MSNAAEIHSSLSSLPKRLDSLVFLYEGQGGHIYEKICQEEGYYLYSNDLALHKDLAPEIARLVGQDIIFVDFGCGTCSKSLHILKALEKPKAFVMVDLDNEVMEGVSRQLQEEMPDLQVVKLLADYNQPVGLPEGRRVGLVSSNFPVYSDKGFCTKLSLRMQMCALEVVTILRSILESLGEDNNSLN